ANDRRSGGRSLEEVRSRLADAPPPRVAPDSAVPCRFDGFGAWLDVRFAFERALLADQQHLIPVCGAALGGQVRRFKDTGKEVLNFGERPPLLAAHPVSGDFADASANAGRSGVPQSEHWARKSGTERPLPGRESQLRCPGSV